MRRLLFLPYFQYPASIEPVLEVMRHVMFSFNTVRKLYIIIKSSVLIHTLITMHSSEKFYT